MKPTIEYYLVMVQVDEKGNREDLKSSLPIGRTINPIIANKAFDIFKSHDSNDTSVIHSKPIPTKEELESPQYISDNNLSKTFIDFHKRFKNRIDSWQYKKLKEENESLKQQVNFSLDDIDLTE